MKEIGKITTQQTNLLETMLPWRIDVTHVNIEEGRDDDIVTETPLAVDYPCSIQALGSSKTGFVTREYIVLCPWIDTTQVPPPPSRGSNYIKVKLYVGQRVYELQDSAIKGISGNPVYELGGYLMGSRIHLYSSSGAIEW